MHFSLKIGHLVATILILFVAHLRNSTENEVREIILKLAKIRELTENARLATNALSESVFI